MRAKYSTSDGPGHYGLASKIGARTQRRISSDCASRPAAWELTSSKTCRMSATGTPSRRTVARRPCSLFALDSQFPKV
jgi:hypothetical protein